MTCDLLGKKRETIEDIKTAARFGFE